MTYEQALAAVFAVATRDDGYNGASAQVQFAFDAETGATLEIADCGYYRSCIPAAADETEAAWLITHHPTARRIYRNVRTIPTGHTTDF